MCFGEAPKNSFILQTPAAVLLSALCFRAGPGKPIQLCAATQRIIHGNWQTELSMLLSRASQMLRGTQSFWEYV